MQGFLGFWIGQKKKFPAIKTQRVGQARHDLIGGMTLAALEMAHVGRRGPDSLCDLLLREFALTPAVADHLPKLLVQHRHGSPLLASPRKKPRYGRFSHPHSKNRVAKIPTLPCCRYYLSRAARASASPGRSLRPRCLLAIGSADDSAPCGISRGRPAARFSAAVDRSYRPSIDTFELSCPTRPTGADRTASRTRRSSRVPRLARSRNI